MSSRARSRPSTLVEQAAAFAAALRFEDLPATVVDKARLQIASVLAACHAGAYEPRARAVAELAASSGGVPQSTLVPGGGRAPLRLAVLANAAHSIAFDYDDYLFLGHTGHSAVLVPLAAAEARGRTLREAVVAQVAANEVMGRLGAYCALGPQNGQFWTFLHLAGASVAAGRMLGLSPGELAHAVALALAQPNFALTPAVLASDAKFVSAAIPASDGVLAAQLAQRGFEGPLDVLDAPAGLGRAFSFAPLREAFSGFGEVWLTETLAFKPHPGCAYVTALVDAILACQADYRRIRGYPLLSTEVESIEIGTTLFTALMDALSAEASEGPLNAVAVTFSSHLSAALTVLNGRLDARDLTAPLLAHNERNIRELARRVRVRVDPSLTADALEHFDEVVGALGAVAGLGVAGLSRLAYGAGRIYGGALREAVPLLADRRLLRIVANSLRRRRRFELSQARAARLRWPFGATVEIRLRTGEVLSAVRHEPSGGPGDPDQARLVRDKLLREAAPTLSPVGAAALAQVVLSDTLLGKAADLLAVATGPRRRVPA